MIALNNLFRRLKKIALGLALLPALLAICELGAKVSTTPLLLAELTGEPTNLIWVARRHPSSQQH